MWPVSLAGDNASVVTEDGGLRQPGMLIPSKTDTSAWRLEGFLGALSSCLQIQRFQTAQSYHMPYASPCAVRCCPKGTPKFLSRHCICRIRSIPDSVLVQTTGKVVRASVFLIP